MKKVASIFIALLSAVASFAQSTTCDKCLSPRITLFDAAIKVPKPAGDTLAWEYGQLSWPSKFANTYIFNNDPSRNCWLFIDKAFLEDKASTANQPAPDANTTSSGKIISEELSYLVTSAVTGTGENSKMIMEIQSACDRKTIARSEVPFSWKDNPDAIQAAGENAARQLMPLNEKIMEYARNLRETDTRYILNGKNAVLKVKPKKTKLGVGEETEVEIQLTDCDGYALRNRKVSFTREMLNGLAVNGTEGGTVTPSVVVTDAEGKAKVKFKLTRADGTATIYGHFIGLNPSGCNDFILGAAHIGGIPVQIGLSYMFHNSQEVNANPKLLHQVQASLGLPVFQYKRHGLALLYYPKKPLKDDFSFSIPARDGEVPAKVKYLRDEGVYVTQDEATGNLASLAIDGTLEKGDRERIRSGNSDPASHTFIKLDWNETDMAELQIEFTYKPKVGDYLNDPVKDTYFFRSSKGASFIKNKITDKDSPYKWEYIITLDRVDGLSDNTTMGTVLSYGGTVRERIEFRMLTPYE